MIALIYSPSKNVMQAGKAKEQTWHLRFDKEVAKLIEPLMGYTSSLDMNEQIILRFSSKESAIDFAKNNKIIYRIEDQKTREIPKKSYSDNFRPDRLRPWTH